MPNILKIKALFLKWVDRVVKISIKAIKKTHDKLVQQHFVDLLCESNNWNHGHEPAKPKRHYWAVYTNMLRHVQRKAVLVLFRRKLQFKRERRADISSSEREHVI